MFNGVLRYKKLGLAMLVNWYKYISFYPSFLFNSTYF